MLARKCAGPAYTAMPAPRVIFTTCCGRQPDKGQRLVLILIPDNLIT